MLGLAVPPGPSDPGARGPFFSGQSRVYIRVPPGYICVPPGPSDPGASGPFFSGQSRVYIRVPPGYIYIYVPPGYVCVPPGNSDLEECTYCMYAIELLRGNKSILRFSTWCKNYSLQNKYQII